MNTLSYEFLGSGSRALTTGRCGSDRRGRGQFRVAATPKTIMSSYGLDDA